MKAMKFQFIYVIAYKVAHLAAKVVNDNLFVYSVGPISFTPSMPKR